MPNLFNPRPHTVERICIYVRRRGLRGRVVTIVDFKSLAHHRCMFESHKGFEISSGDGATQMTCGGSVVLPGCPYVPDILLEWASGVSPSITYSWVVAIRCWYDSKFKNKMKTNHVRGNRSAL